MPLKTKYTATMRRLIYSSIMILPALLTSTIYKTLDTELTTNTKLSNLTALGSSIYLNLQNSNSTLQYSLSQLSSTKEFQSLDKLGIAEQVNNFLYYNKNISNLYILDHNKTNIFGINNNQLSQSVYTDHIDSALRGIPSYYSTFDQNTPFLQFAYPIYNETYTLGPIGVIVATLNLEAIKTLFYTINAMDSSTNIFLTDASGDILVQSGNSGVTSSPSRLDIKRIKSGLDFNPNNTFRDLSDNNVNGIYFTINNSDWTLLLTSSSYAGLEQVDWISLLLGGIGAGGVTTSEIIRKRKSTSASPLENIDAVETSNEDTIT